MTRYVKQGSLFVPQAPHLILRSWEEPTPVACHHRVNGLSGGRRPVAGGSSAASITYASQAKVDQTGTTCTFNGQSIGTEEVSDRLVIVGATVEHTFQFGQEATITGVTIDGNSMTLMGSAHDNATANSTAFAGLWAYNLTSGTTANIVATRSHTMGVAFETIIGVWSVTGCGTNIASAEHDEASDTSGSGSLSSTIDIAADGGLIGMACIVTGGAWSSSTGFTDDFDDSSGAGGSVDELGVETGRTVTFDPNPTSNPSAAVWISFAPA